MKFLYPTFLFALFTIALPIIIHLFSFKRYKTVYFSNVGFLQNIKKESKKKSRLKQLLILIARILTLTFLVFAFSQPYIPNNKDAQKNPSQLVAIYIDNSFSMNARSENGQILEIARNKALEICEAYPAGTKYKLFTNELKPKHQHALNKEQFIQQVSEIKATPVVIPLSLIHNRFDNEQLVNKEKTDKNLYFISDFQRAITDTENFTRSNLFTYYIPLTPGEVANLYIDSCWVEVPAHRLGQEEQVFVKIKNSSDQDYQNLPLKLYLNDSLKSITNFSVAADEEIVADLKYQNNTSGPQKGKIEITDYPFTHDNNWYISYNVEKNLKALAVFNNSKESLEGLSYLKALFQNDDYVILDEMNSKSLRVNKLKEYNTIFLLNLDELATGFMNELEQVVKSGTSIVLFPGINAEQTVLNRFLSQLGAAQIIGTDSTSQKISDIEFENDFYKNVFRKREENPILPQIPEHFVFSRNIRSKGTNLLSFQNGDVALSQLDVELGKLWTFAFSLHANNESFARDVLFVPTIYNITLNSLPKQEISFIVGQNTFYNLPPNKEIDLASTIEIENLATGNKFIPSKTISGQDTRLGFSKQIQNDGHFKITSDNEELASMAFNYNRKESELSYFSSKELQKQLELAQLSNATIISDIDKNFNELFDTIQNGKQLWKFFILFALLFVCFEICIARFMK